MDLLYALCIAENTEKDKSLKMNFNVFHTFKFFFALPLYYLAKDSRHASAWSLEVIYTETII